MALNPDANQLSAGTLFGNRLRVERFILGALLSAATLAVCLSLLQPGDLRESAALIPQQPGVIGLMALAYTAAFGLRALAWRLLLSYRIELGRLFSILQAALFVNHVLPFKAGEIVRPYLAVRHGVPAGEAASTTIVARMLDLVALAIIAIVCLPLGSLSTAALLALATVAAAIVAGGVALLVLRRGLLSFFPAKVQAVAAPAQAGLRQIEAPRLAVASLLVVVSWLLESAVLYGSAHLLHVEVTLQMAAGATAFTILFQVMQLTPGGIGIYETSMTSILVLLGVPAEQALTLAVVTHGLKFAYSFAVGGPFFAVEAVGALKGGAARPKSASSIEIVVARAWNVINEGKPFTPVFTLTILLLLSLPRIGEPSYWPGFAGAVLAVAPLGLLFFRFDFPLKLRAALWASLALFLAVFQFVDFIAVALVISMYLIFTVFVWGTVYYHLRIGTRWTNFLRFWRLVLENPDPTSGNLQEQLPKVLILVLAVQMLAGDFTPSAVLSMEVFTAFVGLSALLVHQWFFTWVPPLPQPLAKAQPAGERISKRFIAIVIDGCRADRLREATTPCIDKLRREGTEYTNVATVYPARTVTCFSSMLTGASPKVHGMRSNFVPSLGVKCDSIFRSLERGGLNGKLVGIAHLIDAFGHEDVRSVTAVMHNDEIDDGLVARGKAVMTESAPDLLVLQLLSVDQTGHARGSYNQEYLDKIEVTDRKIEEFLGWCEARGYLDDATVLITADHGQGIGIGGHGHMSPTEIQVPCILWGKGVEAGVSIDEPRFVTDMAATIAHYLGVENPRESVGAPLLPKESDAGDRPLVYIIPAYNEEANLPAVLASIRSTAPGPYRVVVVDDGSTDATAQAALDGGAALVRHDRNRGLGAALRTGLEEARRLDARAAVYLDADCEYDPAQVHRLLEPIESGIADYVLGSRFKGDIEGMSLLRRIANRYFSILTSFLCLRWISDGQTGFRAFSRRALDTAEIVHDYNYAQVLTMDLLHKGMRLAQPPISYRRRRAGRSFITLRYLWKVPVGMAREVLSE